MSTIEVKSRNGNYKIRFEDFKAIDASKFDFAVVDSNVPSEFLPRNLLCVFLTATEETKTLLTVDFLLAEMGKAGLTRQSQILAIGGGVIQDLVTLAASLYMRGIDWHFVPTTLTGMLDSCIGGKSSINSKNHKNLIGNFHPPKSILIDTIFLTSLPREHLLAGLAEGVKICFAKGQKEFNDYLSNPASLNPSNDANTSSLIKLALTSKKWFVEVDEFDKAERQLLNFGHTFGHAIESATNFSVPHGLGVALGMVAASSTQDFLVSGDVNLLEKYCLGLLSLWTGSVSAFSKLDSESFLEAIMADKKNSTSHFKLILPVEAGHLEIQNFALSPEGLSVPMNALERALKKGEALEIL
jgi:3-dehydroquinate synthase